MANLIQLKRASNYNVSENPGSQTLAEGELAWNNKGDTLWIGKRISTTGTQFNLKRLNPVIQGTDNEIEVTASAADAVNHIAAGETLTVGLPNDVTVGNNLTVNGNCILGNATSDTVTIAGDLTVNGTTTTINSTTVSIDDKTFVLAADAADSNAADGAGIHVTDDIARFTYSHSGTKWVSSKPLEVTGNITTTGLVDGRDVAADGTKLDGIANNANNYSHPTHAGDDIDIDTTALTGATVISDLDLNITTDTLGHVTDANATVATRALTLANLGYTGATDANKFAMTVSNNAGTAAAFASGSTLNITGSSGIVVNRTNSSYTLLIDTSSVCTIDATQILINKTIDGGTF